MAGELTISPKQKVLKETHEKLQALLKMNADAFPKNFNETRFLQNCITVLNDTKDIEKCTPISIARTMIKGAYLGLDFFRRECYAIPYNNELNFQTDYKGEIKLVKRYSQHPIQDIYAMLVREGDVFEMKVEAGKQIVNFTPKNFNDGEIIGAFAVAYFQDGSMRYDAMSKKEIEHIRTQFSKIPQGPAWVKSFGEMCKKVVLRRLCKMLTLDFDRPEQDEAFEDGSAIDINRFDKQLKEDKEKKDIKDPFIGEETVSAEAVIVDADKELRDKFKAKYPNEEDWQIDARIKEAKGAQ